MNALSLYVTTCRMVLQAGSDDAGTWADIHRLLSCLRQSLSCGVCGHLLVIPVSTPPHACCKNCVSRSRKRRDQQMTENIHLRILLQCYKKLCQHLAGAALHHTWGNLNGGTSVNFAEMIQEGSTLPDEFRYSAPSRTVVNGFGACFTPDGTSADASSADSSDTDREEIPKRSKPDANVVQAKPLHRFKPKRKGCRCGLATPNPGKLTCCGQRCPCYVENKACVDCKCRGCRNPHQPMTALPTQQHDGCAQEDDQQLLKQPDAIGATVEVIASTSEVRIDDDNDDVDVDS